MFSFFDDSTECLVRTYCSVVRRHRQRPFCMPTHAGCWNEPRTAFSRPLSSILRRSTRLTFAVGNDRVSLHGSESLTRRRRFSPLDSSSALLAPTCLNSSKATPISLTLAFRPNKAHRTRTTFRDRPTKINIMDLLRSSEIFEFVQFSFWGLYRNRGKTFVFLVCQ